MKVYTAHFDGLPVVAHTRTTAENARAAAMASGLFTAQDRWEKAERQGWTIRPITRGDDG